MKILSLLLGILFIERKFFKNFLLLTNRQERQSIMPFEQSFKEGLKPYIHSFNWISDALKLTLDNIQEFTSLLDLITSACLSDAPELNNLVKTYQIPLHSQTCTKNKNEKYGFYFSRYFEDHTIISRPLEVTLSCAQKKEILHERNRVLKLVSGYKNDQLNS